MYAQLSVRLEVIAPLDHFYNPIILIFNYILSRWSLGCLDSLPEYMKLIYQELINLYQGMEESIENEGKSYQLFYVKEMVICNFAYSMIVEFKLQVYIFWQCHCVLWGTDKRIFSKPLSGSKMGKRGVRTNT